MELLTPALRAALIGNAAARVAALRDDAREPDPAPVVKFFSPVGAATWLASDLDPDGDTLFGLADLGFGLADLRFGCPELGSFSLAAIAAIRLPVELAIKRDTDFSSGAPLSRLADTARLTGSIVAAEVALRAGSCPSLEELPPPRSGDG